MNDFKTGDIVQLKSGGPKMTIKDPIDPNLTEDVLCQWFAGHKLESGYFPRESLNKIVDTEKSEK